MSKRSYFTYRLAPGLAPVRELEKEQADDERVEEAWTALSQRYRLKDTYRGCVKLAKDGDKNAARALLQKIYFLVGNGDDTQWPPELRSYVLDALDRVLSEGASLDDAFNLSGRHRGIEKDARDAQLAQLVRRFHKDEGMPLDQARERAEEFELPIFKKSGRGGDGTIANAYRRYYKTSKKSNK